MKKLLVTILILSNLILPVYANDTANLDNNISASEKLDQKSKSDKVWEIVSFPIALPFIILDRTFNTVGNVLSGNFYKPWLSDEERREMGQKLNQDISNQKWTE